MLRKDKYRNTNCLVRFTKSYYNMQDMAPFAAHVLSSLPLIITLVGVKTIYSV